MNIENISFYLQNHKIEPFDLCRKIGDLFSHMIFVEGFLHSDPHPGNILVRKEPGDKQVTVTLLDHGLYAVSCTHTSVMYLFIYYDYLLGI